MVSDLWKKSKFWLKCTFKKNFDPLFADYETIKATRTATIQEYNTVVSKIYSRIACWHTSLEKTKEEAAVRAIERTKAYQRSKENPIGDRPQKAPALGDYASLKPQKN